MITHKKKKYILIVNKLYSYICLYTIFILRILICFNFTFLIKYPSTWIRTLLPVRIVPTFSYFFDGLKMYFYFSIILYHILIVILLRFQFLI